MNNRHKATCFCGAVEVEMTGGPVEMGYCHCRSCRSYSGAPVTSFTLWKTENVSVTKGADFIGRFNKTGMSDRQFCTKCGGHIMADHPDLGLTDIYGGLITTLPFKPTVHLNYVEKVMPMKDGLPKLKDFPAEVGGSGEVIHE